jgi:hypothetical protein
MKKQTAVNQIFAQIKAGRKDTKFWNDTMVIDWLLEQEERYKQMEKEQIIDAWNGGDYAYFYSKETGRDFADGEQYYNETYGGNNE